jgi:hypothetical protein
MKNIHILPTVNYSPLAHSTNKYGDYFFLSRYYSPMKEMGDSYQHIYITSSEEIKEGDYGIIGEVIMNYSQMHKMWNMPQGKKIILTTDQDLIKDGVQAIDDEFLEWFVKNPSCEEVEVRYEVLKPFQSIDKGYILRLPDTDVLEEPKQVCENCKQTISKYGCACGKQKEEPNQETLEEVECNNCGYLMSLTEDESVYVCYNSECTSCYEEYEEEPKQETLEEAACKTLGYDYNDWVSLFSKDKSTVIYSEVTNWCKGAKWQQERSYSEEDLKDVYFSAIKATGEGWNGEYAEGNSPNIEEKFMEDFNKWFEQFKEK